MTDNEQQMWRQFAAALREDMAEIDRLEKLLAGYRRSVEDSRLRMKCLEQGVKYGEIPK